MSYGALRAVAKVRQWRLRRVMPDEKPYVQRLQTVWSEAGRGVLKFGWPSPQSTRSRDCRTTAKTAHLDEG